MSYCFQGSLYALGIMHMFHIQVLCRAVHHLEIKKKKTLAGQAMVKLLLMGMRTELSSELERQSLH